MSTDTRQQLEDLEKQKAMIQQEIREISSQISLIQPNCFFPSQDPSIKSMIASYEAQRQRLMYQLFDIDAKIDELNSKN